MENPAWKQWGTRFRQIIKEKKLSLGTIAERMGRSESALRSWTNGNREINLSEFFALCAAAEVHPSQALFGGVPLDSETRRRLGELVVGIMDADPAVSQDYRKMSKNLRQTVKN